MPRVTPLVAPIWIEAWAAGARRLGRKAPAGAVVLIGTCGAIDPTLRAGDVVVATEVRHRASRRPADTSVAATLRAHGLDVREGPIVTADRILGPREREALRESGALAVDLESFWLEQAAVVRVVVDEAGRRLLRPGTLVAGVRALRSLRRVGRAIGSA
jgi:4-hydroxy-3-methylbut-2-en-1-yl diphosphate reductase